MYIEDYDLGTGSGSITLIDGDIAGVFAFEFTTYTDYYWYSPDGYHEQELPCLALDELDITSVNYYDEDGNKVSTSWSKMAVEGEITKLIIDNLDKIEDMIKDDY